MQLGKSEEKQVTSLYQPFIKWCYYSL